MHLAIIAGAIAFLLKKPLGLRAAAGIGIGCILGYVYLVGNLPSLHRAAIMYVLGSLSVLGVLPKQPLSMLGITFLIQLCLQPESGQSISFILSYLALGGIFFIGEPVRDLIEGAVPKSLVQPLSASLGAFIATAGPGVSFFGAIYPIGILAGLIVVPLTTLFMSGALLLLIADRGAPVFIQPLELGLALVYTILERLTALCARAPGISAASPVLAAAASAGISGVILGGAGRRYAIRRTLAPFD
jgi:competence protein ComEC